MEKIGPLTTKELSRAANMLDELVKNELTKQRLVDTGKLLNSINFSFTVTNGNPQLIMKSEDYFVYLDRRYGIMKNVYKTSEFKNIVKNISEAIAKDLADEIVRP